MAAQLYKTTSGRLFHAGAIALITVGLPARGKTHIARALCRYLRWLGVNTKVFSLGNYRRQKLGTIAQLPEGFFSPSNATLVEKRHEVIQLCLQDMIEWFEGGGQVGIYDASNTTAEKRREVYELFVNKRIRPVFIESICDKPEIIEANIRSVKILSPDYVGWDKEDVMSNYWGRIKDHVMEYEPVDDSILSFVKVINAGEQIIVNNVNGYLQSRIVYFLMHLHICPRIIYFARAGESTNEITEKVDAELNASGVDYAIRLKNFLVTLRNRERKERKKQGWGEDARPLVVWTSSRKKSSETCRPFAEANYLVEYRPGMAALNLGVVDGLTDEEIKAQYPREYLNAKKDPYHHRYPRGESYHDLAIRLESIILELEREKNDVLIIAHESVLKCLYAYLLGLSEDEIPQLSIPRNYLIEIIPSAYRCTESRLEIVDTLNGNSH